MLLSIQHAVVKTAPSATDSLRHSIEKLSFKVDSLSKIVNKTEIGTGFFSEIISLQLAIFLFFAGLAGFLGWKWFQRQITQTRTECKSHTEELIDKLNQRYDDDLGTLQYDLRKTIFDANRAMCFIATKEGNIPNIFTWSLSSASSLYDLNPDRVTDISIWVQMANDNIIKIQAGNLTIIETKELIERDLKILLQCKDENIQTLLSSIISETNHIIYTKQPPADIMKDMPGQQDPVEEPTTPTT